MKLGREICRLDFVNPHKAIGVFCPCYFGRDAPFAVRRIINTQGYKDFPKKRK